VGATPEDLVSRLDVYEKVRRNRASVMQQFSNAGQDEPEKIREEAAKFIPVEKVPSKFALFSLPLSLVPCLILEIL
jgi:salicylate hydroxylase